MTTTHGETHALGQARRARESRLISLGNVCLDLDTYMATVDGRFVDLTFLQFDLLRLFVENPGRVLPYQFWSLGVLGKFDHGAQRHLSVLVHRLRQKLIGASPYVIKTVRSRGYGFVMAGGADAGA